MFRAISHIKIPYQLMNKFLRNRTNNVLWLIEYLHISLGCDTPILEAVHHTYPRKSIHAIWTRLTQQSCTTSIKNIIWQQRIPSICYQLLDAVQWADWVRHIDIHTGSSNDHIIVKAATPGGYTDKVIDVQHNGLWIVVTYVALTGNHADWHGWHMERCPCPGSTTSIYHNVLLYRKIDGNLYFKRPITNDLHQPASSLWVVHNDRPDSALWDVAKALTDQLDQHHQDYRATSEFFLANYFSRMESLLTPVL
jgi:hypothetical protein